MASGDVSAFNAAVDALVQRGFLRRAFSDPLLPFEHYGIVGERIPIDTKVGNTITDTRPSFLPPKPTSVDPAQATGLDNGITPDQFAIEQFTLLLERHEGSQDENIRTDPIGAILKFPVNVRDMLQQAKSSIDTWKRDILLGGNVPYLASTFNPQGVFRSVFGYASGTTMVTAATTTSINCHVDDASGMDKVLVNGVPTSVSGSNPLPLLVNGVQVANIIGVAFDGYAAGKWGTSLRRYKGASQACGASATLTLDVAVSFTLGAVVSVPNAPLILRPNGKTHFSQLTSNDVLTASLFREATAYLGDNSVPTFDEGLYLALGDRTGFSQLWSDPEMQGYARTHIDSAYVRNGRLDVLFDAMLLPTTNTPFQAPTAGLSVGIRRILIAGRDALRVGPSKSNERYAGIARDANGLVEQTPNFWKAYDDDIVFNIRGPLDRQGETVSMSWNSLNSATCPTDGTANSQITSNWSDSALKRCVLLEFTG